MADKLYPPTTPVDAEDTPRPKSTGVAMWDVNTRAAAAACFIAFVYLCTLILAAIVAAAAVFVAMVYNNTFLVGLDSAVYAVGHAWFFFSLVCTFHTQYVSCFGAWYYYTKIARCPPRKMCNDPCHRRLHSSRFSQHIFYA